MTETRWKWSVAGALGAIALAGAVAYATFPDSGGIIHGCYNTTNGQLRIIDPSAGQTCKVPEAPLDWSQVGPAGATGATGATGVTGPQDREMANGSMAS
jgi:hypothetical protein